MRGTLPWNVPRKAMHHTGRRAYGLRDTRCVSCCKLFRREDVNTETGRCIWCEYDRLPWWQKQLMTDL